MQSWSSYSATIRISPAFIAVFSQEMGETVAQRVEQAPPPDAEGWITITLEFESFEIARSNILGFGTMVEVLEPEDLRQSVIQIASAIVEFYKGSVNFGIP